MFQYQGLLLPYLVLPARQCWYQTILFTPSGSIRIK
jgi:hypothetical protein